MSGWPLVAALAAVVCSLRAAGPLLLHGRRLPPRIERALALLPAALFAALAVTATVGSAGGLALDARLAGLAAAALALAARAPLPLVLVAAAAATAAARGFA